MSLPSINTKFDTQRPAPTSDQGSYEAIEIYRKASKERQELRVSSNGTVRLAHLGDKIIAGLKSLVGLPQPEDWQKAAREAIKNKLETHDGASNITNEAIGNVLDHDREIFGRKRDKKSTPDDVRTSSGAAPPENSNEGKDSLENAINFSRLTAKIKKEYGYDTDKAKKVARDIQHFQNTYGVTEKEAFKIQGFSALLHREFFYTFDEKSAVSFNKLCHELYTEKGLLNISSSDFIRSLKGIRPQSFFEKNNKTSAIQQLRSNMISIHLKKCDRSLSANDVREITDACFDIQNKDRSLELKKALIEATGRFLAMNEIQKKIPLKTRLSLRSDQPTILSFNPSENVIAQIKKDIQLQLREFNSKDSENKKKFGNLEITNFLFTDITRMNYKLISDDSAVSEISPPKVPVLKGKSTAEQVNQYDAEVEKITNDNRALASRSIREFFGKNIDFFQAISPYLTQTPHSKLETNIGKPKQLYKQLPIKVGEVNIAASSKSTTSLQWKENGNLEIKAEFECGVFGIGHNSQDSPTQEKVSQIPVNINEGEKNISAEEAEKRHAFYTSIIFEFNPTAPPGTDGFAEPVSIHFPATILKLQPSWDLIRDLYPDFFSEAEKLINS